MGVTWNTDSYLTVHINGKEAGKVGGVTRSFRQKTTSSVMHLGKISSRLSGFTGFSIDEWYLWGKNLSSEMVAAIYKLY